MTYIRGRLSPNGLLIVFTAAVAIACLILSFFVAARYRTTLIGLASGWGLAFLGSASTAAIAARKSQAKRKEAYRNFLALSDSLVAAHERLSQAKTRHDAAKVEAHAAQKKHASYPNAANEKAAIAANARLSAARNCWKSEDAATGQLQKDYEVAGQEVDRLASHSVRPAFEDLRKCPSQNTSTRVSARSAFVKASHLDPGPPVRADEST